MGANFPVQRRPLAGDRESPREGDGGEARLWHIGTALAVSFTVAVVGLVGLAWLAWVLLGVAGFRRHGPPALHDTVGILQLVFASVAGAGALVALIVAYRRQKVAEADSAHDRTRVFNERFTTIAAQLGDAQPAVRLAGVHAMAGLADDWKANRQTCIDVLCAYLRLPYEPDPGEGAPAPERLAFRASREVRHTVIRVITAHLSGGAAVSWRGLKFDFTGVVFDGGSFAGAEFTGALLGGEGAVSFAGAQFTGGTVDFRHVKFTGGPVSFRSAKFTGGKVDFGFAEFSGGTVDFASAKFTGGKVDFGYAKFSGGLVYFNDAQFTGGIVDFERAEFTGGIVYFDGAEFAGGKVYFGGAEFTGGTVHFSRRVHRRHGQLRRRPVHRRHGQLRRRRVHRQQGQLRRRRVHRRHGRLRRRIRRRHGPLRRRPVHRRHGPLRRRRVHRRHGQLRRRPVHRRHGRLWRRVRWRHGQLRRRRVHRRHGRLQRRRVHRRHGRLRQFTRLVSSAEVRLERQTASGGDTADRHGCRTVAGRGGPGELGDRAARRGIDASLAQAGAADSDRDKRPGLSLLSDGPPGQNRRSWRGGMPALIARCRASSMLEPSRRAVRIASLIATARPRAPRRSASGPSSRPRRVR